MSRPIGAAGLALIQKWEGCRLEAYKAVPTEEYWTIGWGHYGPDVRQGDRITQEEADAILARDCQRFADAVDDPRCVPLTAQLNANQRDALISFAFNCGEGNLQRLCHNRSLLQIRDAMAKYTLSGGKTLVGLERRRAAEQMLFDTPVEVLPEQDNTPAPYARAAVEWALQQGILQGDATGNLNLSAPCTRQQMLVFLYRFANM